MGLDCTGGIVRHVAEPSARPSGQAGFAVVLFGRERNKKERGKKIKKSKLYFWLIL